MTRADSVLKLVSESLAMEAQTAKEAGALGFMARALVQATLPHSRPKEHAFERRNGAFTLTMMAPPRIGLPYGTIPRLVLAWLATEAVKTQSRELVLGDSLSAFMRELDMVPTGGRWGSITRLREQCRRLFTTTISCSYDGEQSSEEMGFRLADRHILWWDSHNAEQKNLFQSSVMLSEAFFREITSHPVPIDLRALRALSRSPLQLDIYCWLTFRLGYLRKTTVIKWPALQAQFGSGYRRSRDFKAAFLEHLRPVLREYKDARAEPAAGGLLLKPAPPHVPFRERKTL